MIIMYDINKMCLIFELCRTNMENKKLVKFLEDL